MSGCGSESSVSVLRPDDRVWTDGLHEEPIEGGHGRGVTAGDRRHLDDFSVDQLDAFVWTENVRLGHPVVFGDGESATRDIDLKLHGLGSRGVVRADQCPRSDTLELGAGLPRRPHLLRRVPESGLAQQLAPFLVEDGMVRRSSSTACAPRFSGTLEERANTRRPDVSQSGPMDLGGAPVTTRLSSTTARRLKAPWNSADEALTSRRRDGSAHKAYAIHLPVEISAALTARSPLARRAPAPITPVLSRARPRRHPRGHT
jgi:hypothetical protein